MNTAGERTFRADRRSFQRALEGARARSQGSARPANSPFRPPSRSNLRRIRFFAPTDPAIQAGLGMAGADPAAVFTELRERKNRF